MGPGSIVIVFTNQKKKLTIESVKNPAISRKAENDVGVFRNWSSVVKTFYMYRARNLVQKRSSDWSERIVPQFTPEEWKEKVRVCPDTFKYVCNKICPELCKKSTVRRTPISVERRVVITFWHLTTDMDYRSIGHPFGVARCTACSVMNEVCTVIIQRLFKLYTSIPSGDSLNQVVQGFADICGFSQCTGAID